MIHAGSPTPQILCSSISASNADICSVQGTGQLGDNSASNKPTILQATANTSTASNGLMLCQFNGPNGPIWLPLQVVNGQTVIQAQMQTIQTNNGAVNIIVAQGLPCNRIPVISSNVASSSGASSIPIKTPGQATIKVKPTKDAVAAKSTPKTRPAVIDKVDLPKFKPIRPRPRSRRRGSLVEDAVTPTIVQPIVAAGTVLARVEQPMRSVPAPASVAAPSNGCITIRLQPEDQQKLACLTQQIQSLHACGPSLSADLQATLTELEEQRSAIMKKAAEEYYARSKLQQLQPVVVQSRFQMCMTGSQPDNTVINSYNNMQPVPSSRVLFDQPSQAPLTYQSASAQISSGCCFNSLLAEARRASIDETMIDPHIGSLTSPRRKSSYPAARQASDTWHSTTSYPQMGLLSHNNRLQQTLSIPQEATLQRDTCAQQRALIFTRCLQYDQCQVTQPNCNAPFKTMADVTRSLLPYHVFHEADAPAQRLMDQVDHDFDCFAEVLIERKNRLMSRYHEIRMRGFMKEERQDEMLQISRLLYDDAVEALHGDDNNSPVEMKPEVQLTIEPTINATAISPGPSTQVCMPFSIKSEPLPMEEENAELLAYKSIEMLAMGSSVESDSESDDVPIDDSEEAQDLESASSSPPVLELMAFDNEDDEHNEEDESDSSSKASSIGSVSRTPSVEDQSRNVDYMNSASPVSWGGSNPEEQQASDVPSVSMTVSDEEPVALDAASGAGDPVDNPAPEKIIVEPEAVKMEVSPTPTVPPLKIRIRPDTACSEERKVPPLKLTISSKKLNWTLVPENGKQENGHGIERWRFWSLGCAKKKRDSSASSRGPKLSKKKFVAPKKIKLLNGVKHSPLYVIPNTTLKQCGLEAEEESENE